MQFTKYISIVCTLASLLAFGSMHINKEKTTAEKIDTYIAAWVKLNKFNGAVLVAKDRTIVLSKGYGPANHELDVLNTPQTKFRIGSITKLCTAIAIMQLQEKGLLKVSDTVDTFIPDYPQGNKITLHHLLTHTAGIPNYVHFPNYKKNSMVPITIDELIALFKDKPLECEPGSTHRYSNSGYVLLAFIIEKVSGKTYSAYLTEHILVPSDMHATGIDSASIIIKNRASGYSFGSQGLKNAQYIDMSWSYGAGNLYSTVEDLYALDQSLYTEKIVKKESFRSMCKPYKNDYCYALISKEICGRRAIYHGGSVNGFSSNFVRFPQDNVCIVLLSNIEGVYVDKITQDLSAIICGCCYELPKARTSINICLEHYDEYSGTYEVQQIKPSDAKVFITILKEHNKLYIKVSDEEEKFELLCEAPDRFYPKFIDVPTVSFVKDLLNKVIGLKRKGLFATKVNGP